MNGARDRHERVYRGLLRVYPAEFRARFADEMVGLFADQLRDARAGGGAAGMLETWSRALGDLAVTAMTEHARRNRTVAHSLAGPPSLSSRLLGLVGIIGGFVLIAAFLPGLPWTDALFNLRLVLFNAGAIAIVVAVHRRQAAAAPAQALAAAVPALIANAWYLGTIILAVGRPGPVAANLGLAFFWAGAAMWLADAWFGLATMRIGIVSRWAALALAVGSVLAFTGMDGLGLVSGPFAQLFEPLALFGIALNGLGWIALGIDVATRRVRMDPNGQPKGTARGAVPEPGSHRALTLAGIVVAVVDPALIWMLSGFAPPPSAVPFVVGIGFALVGLLVVGHSPVTGGVLAISGAAFAAVAFVIAGPWIWIATPWAWLIGLAMCLPLGVIGAVRARQVVEAQAQYVAG